MGNSTSYSLTSPLRPLMVAMPSLHRSLAAREPFICRSEFLPYDDISLTTPPLGVSPALSRARGLALCGRVIA
jgi:hypothetical protein